MKIICGILKTIIKVYTLCMIPPETHMANNHEIIIFLVRFLTNAMDFLGDNVKLFFSISGSSDHRLNNSFKYSLFH